MPVELKDYDPTQPIIYTHVPKCAGTSLLRQLRRWFGDEYHKLNQDESKDIKLPRVDTQDADGNWLPNVKVIHGHFNHERGYGLPYHFPEVNQYFTVLRDPFELCVSMYFFVKGKSAAGEFWNRGEQVDIREHYPHVEAYVNSYPSWIYNHLPQDLSLDNYVDKLREKFVYIGVFEDLQVSIRHLASILRKPFPKFPRANVSTYDEPIPEHLRQKFYDDYPLLKAVYDYGRRTYRQRTLKPVPRNQKNNPQNKKVENAVKVSEVAK